jgi:ligand-binding sensor domain-containing protein
VPHTYIGDTIYAITEDNANLLWMATRGLVSRDSTGKMQHILLDKKLSSYKNIINNISKDSANELWLATNAGLYSFDPVTHNLKTYHRKKTTMQTACRAMLYLRKERRNGLWVGTDNGLGLLDTKTGMFKNYLHDPKDSNSISSNYITGIITESMEICGWVPIMD